MALKAPGLVLDMRGRQRDLGITYIQSPTRSRGNPVHHQETSRHPPSPQGPPASRSSHCASVEPGRCRHMQGLGPRAYRASTGPRDSRHIHGQSDPSVLQRAGYRQMAPSPPTKGHGSSALSYLQVATRDHWLTFPLPYPCSNGSPYTPVGPRAHSKESETKTGCLRTRQVFHFVCALGKQRVALSQSQECPGTLQAQHRPTVSQLRVNSAHRQNPSGSSR